MLEKSENILVNADNPGSQLVPFKINGTNFNICCKQFTITVTSKNKLGFLIGEEVEPDVQLHPIEHKKWVISNATVHSWIFNGLNLELSSGFLYLSNCKAL